MDQTDRGRRGFQLLRDVHVNVLANLVAAVVIFLLGAAVGLFPRSREAVVTAVLVLFMVVVYLLSIVGEVTRNSHHQGLYTSGSLVALGGFFATVGITQANGDPLFWWICVPLSAPALAIGGWGVYREYRAMKAAQAADRRLKGLSWYEPQ
ncbi:hypothetical protein [Actinoplanes sp. L3-i22]|uniref:hypothetical protein n=1 Tax=Actinoplanes sp. L3-i22 TaxID=2836373 RepID=UPI001C761701|nr:hypothetical protein [Actinoplanes sp. L3-i22]BCY07311.1 hypothetical protein L3i22_023990 [Actinoplanes sp. L3-i22]